MSALNRLEEHKTFFIFGKQLLEFGKGLFDDFEDLVNLMFICTPADKQPEIIESTFECKKTFLPDDINCFSNIENGPNSSRRLQGVFVSPNVFNLSKRQLSTSEISLLSKGLKFVPTPNFVNRAILKEELEIFGGKLRLKWHERALLHSILSDRSLSLIQRESMRLSKCTLAALKKKC